MKNLTLLLCHVETSDQYLRHRTEFVGVFDCAAGVEAAKESVSSKKFDMRHAFKEYPVTINKIEPINRKVQK